ncbi:metal ABC transporter ATP-binding protein [Luteococcus sp. Sow4_B9]|uniref:metal ABC transporter ATP-binding protein n=1 Tax=Luteococcus sp. Sow4_B9 TaxID=3438792 RepID=UPI003F9C6CC5
MTSAPHSHQPHDEVTPLLEGRDLVVNLQGHLILNGVSARVMPGETVALLGGNGSGKTTLVRALLGLNPVTRGGRELFGTPLRSFHDWHRVGYVPQRGSLQLANATVREVVATGRLGHRPPFIPERRKDKQAIEDALERVRLSDRKDMPFLRMSGGQQQRALIARALCTSPDLLVLDEPLTGLDTTSQRGLSRVLHGLEAEGLGILVVLHDLGPLADLIDRSIVLRDGLVIHDGPLLPGTGLHHLPDEEPHHPMRLPDPTPRRTRTSR